MYKFAIITHGIVSNIIEANDYDIINNLKQYNDTVILINNQDVEINYLWDGSKFYKDPILVEKENKIIQRQMAQLAEQKLKLYEELKEKENLTEEEKEILDNLKEEME